ncbi:MAG: alpha/beta fold hydrolase [Candidatus Baltobacteraceae bacterium]
MRVRVDGAAIDVAANGKGDAVMLVHGFPLSKKIWDAQAAALADRALVIRPDLRGMGESSAPPGPYLMETLAGDLAAVLDAMQIERAAIVGHSMGGYVAMAFARMYTERVTKLALVCSRLKNDAPDVAQNRENIATVLEGENPRVLTENPYLTTLFSPLTLENHANTVELVRALVRANRPAGLAAALRGMAQRLDARDIAQDFDFPVLVVAGARDRLITLGEAEEVRTAFPAADLRVLGSSGHLPMLEEPQALSEVLETFLSARPSGAGRSL